MYERLSPQLQFSNIKLVSPTAMYSTLLATCTLYSIDYVIRIVTFTLNKIVNFVYSCVSFYTICDFVEHSELFQTKKIRQNIQRSWIAHKPFWSGICCAGRTRPNASWQINVSRSSAQFNDRCDQNQITQEIFC